jgi:hypothetical protein
MRVLATFHKFQDPSFLITCKDRDRKETKHLKPYRATGFLKNMFTIVASVLKKITEKRCKNICS